MPDDPLEDTETDTIDPADLAALRAEIAALKAKSAMLEAGVDLSTPTGKMFLRAYDGEVDVEKIKVAAAEIPGALKLVETPKPEGDGEDREPGEGDQFRERGALTNEAPAGTEDPDPKAEILGALDREIQAGARVESAIGATMQRLVAAANSGDERVLASRNAG